MSLSFSSILVFDINKKYLLYKILNKEIRKLLLDELSKNYGELVGENNDQEQQHTTNEENLNKDEGEVKQGKSNSSRLLSDDFIYGYFSPIVNSFEISKEMNFIYQYALFNNNQYIIRFNLYDNCLILCVFNYNVLARTKLNSNLNKLVFNEYYTSWCCKSIISLIKYKFGICSDERCFNQIDDDLKKQYVKWSQYHSIDIIYFVEAIEYLQVNDETSNKCELFIKEFFDFLIKRYLKTTDDATTTDSDDDDDDDNEDNETSDENDGKTRRNTMRKAFDDDDTTFPPQTIHKTKQETTQVDEVQLFFEDFTRIHYYMLTYGTKMLYKSDAKILTENNNLPNINTNLIQILDSSSLFMLLLEAATFIDYTLLDPFAEDSDRFSSPTTSPSETSVVDTDENNSAGESRNANGSSKEADTAKSENIPEQKPIKLTTGSLGSNVVNSYTDSFKSIASTPMYLTGRNSYMTGRNSVFKSPIDELKISSTRSSIENIDKSNTNKSKSGVESFKDSDIDEEIVNALNLKEQNLKQYKLTHCFLRNSTKSYNFYDVLFVKLDTNLCFIMLKLSKLSKYCELITDLDTHLNELLEIINRKRLILTNIEAEASQAASETSSISSLDTTPSPSPSISSLKSFFTPSVQEETEETKFLSIFINKSITFHEKLKTLKNEINAQILINNKMQNSKMNSNSQSQLRNNDLSSDNKYSLKDSILKQAVKIKNKLNVTPRTSTRRGNYSSSSLFSEENEVKLKQQVKLITNLQTKVNQLVNNKQFVTCLNLPHQHLKEITKTTLNQLLNNYQNIESQITSFKQSLKDLLFEMFLSDKMNKTNSKCSSKALKKWNYSQKLQRINSFNFMDSVKDILKSTNLHLYTSFMEVKLRQNITMTYYWHQLPGLLHFSFINRQDNLCLIPAINASLKYNCNELSINLAYRKYYPIVITLLYKYDCTQFQFIDDQIGIVFNYFIWFEDKNANYIPVDLNTTGFVNSNTNNNKYDNQQRNNGTQSNNPQTTHINTYFNIDQKSHYPPGITLLSYYDLLRKLCYPNAPNDSLSCYEMMCIHSNRLDEGVIKDQCERLATQLTKHRKPK